MDTFVATTDNPKRVTHSGAGTQLREGEGVVPWALMGVCLIEGTGESRGPSAPERYLQHDV